ncbi:pre-mRNA-splicing factor 38B-like [Mercenaria mercenaria]|uniref:pre-mRNA-splicing factor 38B-like n=1 Tax=Mercenaria mercenaria TaxID=6596 RepID=UPI00234F3E2A|nr:pre-mRNA-splicing factor 38B-like [Mercenaria mercenaria]
MYAVPMNQTPTTSQYPYMSEGGGGGASAGIFVGVGVGACALIVGVIAVVIYCYMKARKEKANSNMTKSTDVFSTAASNTQYDYPQRSKVNQFPDPEAARRSRRRERGRDAGHSNPAFTRHSSDTSSISDADGRDLSPPRARRPRGGQLNDAFSSESSYEDSSSVEDEVVGGNYRMERETDREKERRTRSSYKRATGRQDDLLDGSRGENTGRYRRTDDESQRMSRRDEFSKRNPRSDSPLTIETLEKHEKNLARRESKEWEDQKAFKNRSRKRDSSPSRTYESSEVTQASLTTEGTEFTATTMSSTRFQKNPSLRRNSPSRSSSHRRYRKDNEKDEHGRRKPRRTRSKDRSGSHDRQSDRSRSPGSSRSGSGSTRRSRSSSAREAKRINKEQAMLPIFADAQKKKSSAV